MSLCCLPMSLVGSWFTKNVKVINYHVNSRLNTLTAICSSFSKFVQVILEKNALLFIIHRDFLIKRSARTKCGDYNKKGLVLVAACENITSGTLHV